MKTTDHVQPLSERPTPESAEQVLILGTRRCQRLARAHVVVVGTGRIGSTAALALHAAGIGTLTLIDPQQIEKTQVRDLVFATPKDIGQYKADVLAAFLHRRGFGRVVPVALPVEHSDFQATAKTASFLLCCANHMGTRLFVERIAIEQGVPILQAAVYDGRRKLGGVLTVWRPDHPGLACYGCLVSEVVPTSVGAVFMTATQTLGQMAAHRTVLHVAGFRDETLRSNVVLADLEQLGVEGLTIARRPSCPICG